jgi:hypothetical protein
LSKTVRKQAKKAPARKAPAARPAAKAAAKPAAKKAVKRAAPVAAQLKAKTAKVQKAVHKAVAPAAAHRTRRPGHDQASREGRGQPSGACEAGSPCEVRCAAGQTPCRVRRAGRNDEASRPAQGCREVAGPRRGPVGPRRQRHPARKGGPGSERRRRSYRDRLTCQHAGGSPVAAQAADRTRQRAGVPDVRRGQRPPALRDRGSGADRRHRAR